MYVDVFMRDESAAKLKVFFWVTDSGTQTFWKCGVKWQLSVSFVGPSNFMQNSAGIKSGKLNYFVLTQCTY